MSGVAPMRKASAPPAPAPAPTEVDHRALAWLHAKDPDYLVIKRSLRAAVVVPSLFAIAHFAFTDAQVGLFAAFGSFALLLFVEFTGKPRTRLVSYVGLWVVGSIFVVVGTVASTNKVAAVVAMGVVGFLVLFSGIVAPQAATASTAGVAPVRPVRRGGAAGLGDRVAHDRLGDGGCVLHRGRAVGLAATVA